MIDIVAENERNLKNVRQIGKPCEADKIYIENTAYARIHAEDYADKRIFIFMGHTECENNRYTTFVEAAIPVPDITFQQNIPQWSSHAWSGIFQEIKRAYDSSIIVGWSMDIKGFSPRMTPELEAVHREQFGGAHQVLFLMDSVEGEECFYMNKGNSLQKKDGFFIYYASKPQRTGEAEVTVEIPGEAVFRGGKSRLLLGSAAEPEEREEKEVKNVERRTYSFASYAMTAAILVLIGLVGIGVYQDRIKLSNLEETVNVMGNHIEVMKKDEDAKVTEAEADGETTETISLIPVIQLPSGEIRREERAEEKDDEADVSSEKDSGQSGSGEAEAVETAAEAQTGSDTDNEPEGEEKPDEQAAAADVTVPEYYVVQKGDTLTSIARKFYNSLAYVEKLAELNQLENYDNIREGEKLLLP